MENTDHYSFANADLTDTLDRSKEQTDYFPLENDVIIDDIDLKKMIGHNENWSKLFFKRLTNPEVKDRFIKNKKRFAGASTYEKMSEESISHAYYKNIGNAFTETHIGNAEDYGYKPIGAGIGGQGDGFPGVVFNDAIKIDPENTEKPIPLTVKEKMIVEAHEKSHGVLDFYFPLEITVIEDAFDLFQFRNGEASGYERQNLAFELVARMTQLKNYFGFTGNERFTQYHLDYARKHYIEDTGFDNNMTDFFRAIPPDKEKKFIALMNNFAC